MPTVEVGFSFGLGNSVVVSFLREVDVEVMTIVWPSFMFCPSNARTFCGSLVSAIFVVRVVGFVGELRRSSLWKLLRPDRATLLVGDS